MARKSAPLDKVQHTHDVSLTVKGIPDAQAAQEFFANLLSVPGDQKEMLTVVESDEGFILTGPPLCCVDDWWGFVWNGVCEWRGDGCPA